MLNKDIVTMYRGLTSLASDLETKLPAKVSFAIVRNIKLLTPIVEDIDFIEFDDSGVVCKNISACSVNS